MEGQWRGKWAVVASSLEYLILSTNYYGVSGTIIPSLIKPLLFDIILTTTGSTTGIIYIILLNKYEYPTMPHPDDVVVAVARLGLEPPIVVLRYKDELPAP